MALLNSLPVSQDDVFRKVAWLLDYLLFKTDVGQQQVDSLWTHLLTTIREWKPDATPHDKAMVAGTVFHIVRAMLAQRSETIYCETICEMLNDTLERELKDCDRDEQQDFLHRLTEQSPMLAEWINGYDEADCWLYDEIERVISNESREADKDSFEPSGTTFTKTALLTDILIDIIGQRLTVANKLKASPDDFRKLFSGNDQQFTMTWLGTDGELRDLFKMITNVKKQYATPHRGYQQILRSHFVDADGNWFNNLHGAKSIKTFKSVIDDCSLLLQRTIEAMTNIMKELISTNQDALRDAGFYDPVQAAKQSGLSIKKKRR